MDGPAGDPLEERAREILREECGIADGELSPKDVRAVVRGMRWAAEECATLAEIDGHMGSAFCARSIRARFAAKEQEQRVSSPESAAAREKVAQEDDSGFAPPQTGNVGSTPTSPNPQPECCPDCGHTRGVVHPTSLAKLDCSCGCHAQPEPGNSPRDDSSSVGRKDPSPAEGLAGSRGAGAPAVSPLDRAALIEKAHQFWRESHGYSFSMMADFALSVMPKPSVTEEILRTELERTNEAREVALDSAREHMHEANDLRADHRRINLELQRTLARMPKPMSDAETLERAAEIIETQPGHGESQALLRMWATKLRADAIQDAAELAEIARINELSAKPAPTFDEAIAFLEKQRDMPESMAKKWRERIRAHRDDDTEEFTVDLMEDFIEDLDRLSARAGKEAGK